MTRAPALALAAIVLIGPLLEGPAPAATGARDYETRALNRSEIRTALKGLAPPASEISRKQAYLITLAGQPAVALVPIRYDAPTENRPSRIECAVIVAPRTGASYSIVTVGQGERDVLSCTAILAVGFIAGQAGTPPAIALMYRCESPNYAVQVPVVLSWDGSARRYVLDEAASKKADSGHASSIADIRKVLSPTPESH